MTEEMIAEALKTIEAMLRDPTCEVEWARGVNRQDRGTGFWEFAPNESKTLTIKVHGGAQERTLQPSWLPT